MAPVARTDWLDTACQPIDRAPGQWLASYPFFQDALRRSEATFQALPHYAKAVVLKRIPIDLAEQALSRQKFVMKDAILFVLLTRRSDDPVTRR